MVAVQLKCVMSVICFALLQDNKDLGGFFLTLERSFCFALFVARKAVCAGVPLLCPCSLKCCI